MREGGNEVGWLRNKTLAVCVEKRRLCRSVGCWRSIKAFPLSAMRIYTTLRRRLEVFEPGWGEGGNESFNAFDHIRFGTNRNKVQTMDGDWEDWMTKYLMVNGWWFWSTVGFLRDLIPLFSGPVSK